MVLMPVIVAVVVGGVAHLVTKGISVSKAAEDIAYKLKVKDLRIHKISLVPFTIDTRFALDIELTNPTKEVFKISHPDIIIKYAGQEIGRSVISNKVYELKGRSKTTIKDIQFQIDLAYLSDELSDFIKLIKEKWEIGKGLVYNVSKANETLNNYKDLILKHLSAKVSLSINRIPISYEDTLAGGESLGSFILGYAPVSAIDRKIVASPQLDKYFPIPTGKKEVIKRNASTVETVNLMIDIVNKDHSLIKEASFKLFKRPTVEETARNIFDWVYKHIKYNLEIGEQLRNPVTTYHLGQRLARKHYAEKGYYPQEFTADCDDMSIFVASILKNLGIPYMFRIADYSGGGYSHVYTLIPRQGKPPIIIDPVYHTFNAEKSFIKEKTFNMDKKALSGIDVYYLSGLGSPFGTLTGTDEDTFNYLLKSRAEIASNPDKYRHIAHPDTLIQMYDYAIKYWNTPNRDTALDYLINHEDALISQGFIRAEGIAGLGKIKFFEKLKQFRNKITKLVKGGKTTPEISKHEEIVHNSNYANMSSSAPANTTKPNNFVESAKAFVSQHKVPVIIGSSLLAGGIALAISNKRKKAKDHE